MREDGKSRNEDTNTNECMGANICPADSKMPPENFENGKILPLINDDCSMIVTRTTRRFEKKIKNSFVN